MVDTRADFQRLLEDMDKVIQSKRQELTELDERLEIARVQLSEKEASELQRVATEMDLDGDDEDRQRQQQLLASGSLDEQRRLFYEQQLEQFGEELTELESINQTLAKANETLRFELSSNRKAFEKLQAQSNVLAENLDEVQSANLELNLRLARAEAESQMQQKLLKKSHNEDEVLMNAFNDKLDSMKRAIEWRDEEIRRLSQNVGSNQLTLESLGATLIVDPANKQNVIEIANALREKDSQIELLRGQLLEATKDLEENANLLELAKRQESQLSDASRQKQQEEKCLEQQEELLAKNRMLEDELEAKDKQLSLAELRLHHYETTLPNMIRDLIEKLSTRSWQQQQVDSNLVGLLETLAAKLSGLLRELSQSQRFFDEIEHLKEVCQAKDGQIERLVSELNELDAKFGLVQHQCDLLQSSRLQVVGATSGPPSAATSGGNQQQQIVSAPVASSLEKPEASIRASDKKATEQASFPSSSAVAATTPTTADSSEQQPVAVAPKTAKVASFDRAVLRLQSRLRQLECENELLELAMKEILLSIKWSDAQCSTVLIDCPSLERLCQLIEARFLARHSLVVAGEQQQAANARSQLNTASSNGSGESQIFQLVVLKSELDLLRGQNEQLRAEVKLQRREYQEDLLGAAIRQQQLGRTVQLESELVASTRASAADSSLAEGSRQAQLEELGESSPMEEAVSSCEVACQTTTATTTSGSESCKNCARLTNLANHLLQCISRIEAHVNMSDESYLNRLVSLHKLNQLLERDLLARESLLNESRHQCQLLAQQKLKAELRLQVWREQQQTQPQQAAAMGGGRQQQPAGSAHMHMIALNGRGDSISRQLAIISGVPGEKHKQGESPAAGSDGGAAAESRRYPRARLDYKDERLRQLEALTSRSSRVGSSDSSSSTDNDNSSNSRSQHFVSIDEPARTLTPTPARQEIIEVS